MKNLHVLLIISFVMLFSFSSCDKTSLKNDENITEVELQDNQFQEFEEALTYGISLLEDDEILRIWKSNGKYDWDVQKIDRNSISLRAYDCESTSAIKFAKCVKKLVEKGDCVKVGYTDGKYHGEVVDC